MPIEHKRVAILVEKDFEDAELSEPLQALRDAGARVTVVGPRRNGTYTGYHRDFRIAADTTAKKVSAKDFDAVVIPGGYAPDKMRLNRAMVDFVADMDRRGKLVAAVCHGPQLLISAGVVRGRRVTSWPSVAVDLKNAGAEWVDREVVIDGNLITSRQPADLPAFDEVVLKALQGDLGPSDVAVTAAGPPVRQELTVGSTPPGPAK
jgi:protease I